MKDLVINLPLLEQSRLSQQALPIGTVPGINGPRVQVDSLPQVPPAVGNVSSEHCDTGWRPLQRAGNIQSLSVVHKFNGEQSTCLRMVCSSVAHCPDVTDTAHLIARRRKRERRQFRDMI